MRLNTGHERVFAAAATACPATDGSIPAVVQPESPRKLPFEAALHLDL
jgi:hypothetical protein